MSEYLALISKVSPTESEMDSAATGSTVILTGTSDPGRVLYLNGKPVGRHKNGDFAVKVRLSAGENRFLFTQTGEEKLIVLYR